MIPQPALKQQQPLWQQRLQALITDPQTLLSLVEVSPTLLPWQLDKQFPLRVTPSFVARMKKGDPADPLLLQVLPVKTENQSVVGFSCDPLQEKQANPIPGLLHKYPSRALITLTPNCAIHCRYCFRRHFPYEQNTPGRKGWELIWDYLGQHSEIMEVILSGGDPLLATDDYIAQFLEGLANFSHIQLLRFHTRLPILIPERIYPDFLKRLPLQRFHTTFVYHINHSAELIPAISEGVQLLKTYGITVLNQSVLLKGINDNLACLKQLSLNLFKAGILPYYLHLPDAVKGTHHFAVSLTIAKQLAQALREALPGYLVPRFVQEIPHTLAKTPLDLINV